MTILPNAAGTPRTAGGGEAGGRVERSLRWIFVILALAALGMGALLALLPAAGHDQLWFLLMARRWLDGARLYGAQIFDSNPPGIVWLSALPVLFGNTFHVAATTMGKLFVALAEILALMLSHRFLIRGWRATRSYEVPALLFAAIVLFVAVPARDFGQRDQMAAFLLLPYVLAAAVDVRTPGLTAPRCVAGAMAALGVCLKPHFALVAAAVELALLLVPETNRVALVRAYRMEAALEEASFEGGGYEGSNFEESDGSGLDPEDSGLERFEVIEHEMGDVALAGHEASAALEPSSAELELEARLLAPASRMRTLLRPEPVLVVLGGVYFVLAAGHLAPLYFSVALPLVRETYWAIGHLSADGLALEAIELCVLAAVAIALFFARKPGTLAAVGEPCEPTSQNRDVGHPELVGGSRSPAVRLLLVAGAGAAVAYFVQGTGWYYQQLPAIDLFGAALALELLDLLDAAVARGFALPRGLTGAVAALCLLALGLTTYFTGAPFTADRAFALSSPDPAFFAALKAGTPVAILTTSVDEAMMPVERYHLTWAQRTDNLWLMPAILRSENQGGSSPAASRPASSRSDSSLPAPSSPASSRADSRRAGSENRGDDAGLHSPLSAAELGGLEALQHRWMVEDLNRWRPQLVLVGRCQSVVPTCQELESPRLAGAPSNLLAWFLRDPALAAVWAHYRFAGSRGRFDAYTLAASAPGP